MKVGHLPVLAILLMGAVSGRACSPIFPVSYFPRLCEYCDVISGKVTTRQIEDEYLVRPHLGTELAMIGAHYYPAWTGKAPQSNNVRNAQADEMDFFAAGLAAGVAHESVAKEWQRFTAFHQGVCKRLEDGEEVKLPQDIPDYAQEFYLYKLGHAQWLVFRRDEDPAPFGQLMALPKAQRLYRTVWVHFVRIANARTFQEKDRHVDTLRRAVDAGFKDTVALASQTLRMLSNKHKERYDPLVLTSYSQTEWKDWPEFAKRIFCRRGPYAAPTKAWLETLCTDSIGIEVAIAFGGGGNLPHDAVPPDKPALGADRQAWIAFNSGDFGLCRKLLAQAPKQSLIRMFLEARLARFDGNYTRAAERLHEWLAEYRRKGQQADASLVGFSIDNQDGYYWDMGLRQDNGCSLRQTIYYTGPFGPARAANIGFHGRMFEGDREEQSCEPTLPRVVAGELGVVKVATRDLEEALSAFLQARNWLDTAFVAERCLTVDELLKFVRDGHLATRDAELLRNLLMRRLVRNGRPLEAAMWAPRELKPLCDEYCELLTTAFDTKTAADTRALAFLNLSRLTATRGMELMGTELRPDVAIYKGRYPEDCHPLAEPKDVLARLNGDDKEGCWKDWTAPADRVTGRYHYRRKAIAFAKAAVLEAKDPDVRAWALMYGGIAALSLDDPKEGDWFYKKLAVQRHPRAKVGAWFSGEAYLEFKKKYYDDDRHGPLRVPTRLTLEQLKQL